MIETLSSVVQEMKPLVTSNKEASINPLKETIENRVTETPILNLIDTIDNTSLECLKAQNESIRIPTRNESLEGSKHPETGVEFEKKTIKVNGETIEVVVPQFDSEFDAMLPDNLKEASDKDQFAECNRQLIEAVDSDLEFKAKFNEQQLEQIENKDTPDGYTWHHDAEVGKMQLVDSEIHSRTGHTGGKLIWGGGSENR